MKNKRIYLSSPHMGGSEKKYINRAFKTNWIAPLGPNVDAFENSVKKYLNIDSAVALNSGTSAIHLALKCLGAGEGDIVFVSSLTFAGSANPVVYCGANPVFLDSNLDTWNMCPDALEKAYQKYPNPKALIVVDLYGNPADYDRILKIAASHNTPVIEDAAESLGSLYKGKKCGTLGELGVLSFNGNKIITTSGGGMLVSKKAAYIEHARFLATQAREKARHYEHKELGYNYRLSNVCAGVGLGQMEVLDKRVRQKTAINKYYREAFSDIKEISFMPTTQGAVANNWLTCVLIEPECDIKPLDIIEALEAENIESRPIWKPMHMQPYYQSADFVTAKDSGSVAEYIYLNGLCLPSDTKMSKRDLDRVAKTIRKCFGK